MKKKLIDAEAWLKQCNQSWMHYNLAKLIIAKAPCYEVEEGLLTGSYADRQGEFTMHGVCMKGYFKNGSYTVYPVYVPGGVCKKFKKRKERKKHEND